MPHPDDSEIRWRRVAAHTSPPGHRVLIKTAPGRTVICDVVLWIEERAFYADPFALEEIESPEFGPRYVAGVAGLNASDDLGRGPLILDVVPAHEVGAVMDVLGPGDPDPPTAERVRR